MGMKLGRQAETHRKETVDGAKTGKQEAMFMLRLSVSLLKWV